MNFPDKETVARVRAQYPKGARVELVLMDDPFTTLSSGERGSVICVDDTATVHVAWDCGSSLGAVYGEDVIRRLPEQEVRCLNCGHVLRAVPERDGLGWHCACPECGASFEVDEEEDT